MASFLYRSPALVQPRSEAEARIWFQAQHNNEADGITGHLRRDCDWFAQYVEGPPNALGRLLVRLRRDERHGPMQILLMDNADRPRRYPDWSMSFDADAGCSTSTIPDESNDALMQRLAAAAAERRADKTWKHPRRAGGHALPREAMIA